VHFWFPSRARSDLAEEAHEVLVSGPPSSLLASGDLGDANAARLLRSTDREYYPTISASQATALIDMISQYAATQPNTDLKDVIAGFLLDEAKNPLDSELQQYEKSRTGYEVT
jgi:hypothetical protein